MELDGSHKKWRQRQVLVQRGRADPITGIFCHRIPVARYCVIYRIVEHRQARLEVVLLQERLYFNGGREEGLPTPGYDNHAGTRARARRKWGSILNLAENGDLEFKKIFLNFFLVFIFLIFGWLRSKGGQIREERHLFRGVGCKKVHRKFWLEKSRPQTFEILS